MSENKTEVQGFATKEEYGERLGNFQLGCLHVVKGRILGGDIDSPLFQEAKTSARELLDRLNASPFAADDETGEIVDATPEEKAEHVKVLEIGFACVFGSGEEQEEASKAADVWLEQRGAKREASAGEVIPAAAGSVC